MTLASLPVILMVTETVVAVNRRNTRIGRVTCQFRAQNRRRKHRARAGFLMRRMMSAILTGLVMMPPAKEIMQKRSHIKISRVHTETEKQKRSHIKISRVH